MEAIKEIVERALERKRVLSQMKAELRAQVFLAIEEEEIASGNEGLAAKTSNPQLESLVASADGKLLVALVREFLEWAGLEFTAKVFEPEVGPAAQYHGRMSLSSQLGMPADVACQEPLLLKLLKHHQSGDPGSLKPQPAQQQQQQQPRHPPQPHQGPPPVPAMRPPITTSAPNPQEQTQQQQPSKQPSKTSSARASEQSFNDEVESDEELAGAEVVDEEEEDYSAVVGKSSGAPASAPATSPHHDAGSQPQANSGNKGDRAGNGDDDAQARDDSHTGAGSQPGAPGSANERQGREGGAGMDLSGSSLSTSGFLAGRLRPHAGSRGHALPQEDAPRHFEQSDDLLASDDRSGAISHELGGMHTHHAHQQQQQQQSQQRRGAGEDSGGLSFSGELPQHPDDSGDLSRSSRSLDNPGTISRSPLGKLAPLGPPPLAPLSGNKLGPLNAPRVLSPRSQSNEEVKEELYRAGLLDRSRSRPDQSGSLQESDAHSHSGSSKNSGEGASSRRSSGEDLSEHADLEAPESHSHLSREGSKRSTGDNHRTTYDESKAMSMDLRDTGLSASDQSGDLETGLPLAGLDMEETAEWGS